MFYSLFSFYAIIVWVLLLSWQIFFVSLYVYFLTKKNKLNTKLSLFTNTSYLAGRWDNFIDDVWHFQYNYCRFRHAVVSAMTGTKKRVGSGHKSARFAELVKQVQSINQASREGKMPAGQCAQLVLWANVKITNFCSHFPTLLENNWKFPQFCTV